MSSISDDRNKAIALRWQEPATKGDLVQALVAIQGVAVKLFALINSNTTDRMDAYMDAYKKLSDTIETIAGWEEEA